MIKGSKMTKEQKKRLSDAHLGSIHSGSFKKGHKSLWNKDTAKKMSEKMSGSKHHLWKGGDINLTAIKRWKLRNKDKIIKDRLENKDYINAKALERKIKKQENLAGRKRPEQCEICGSIGRICYDHCHTTGKFRGWICIRCNSVLGFVKDNSETLLALVKYLKLNR